MESSEDEQCGEQEMDVNAKGSRRMGQKPRSHLPQYCDGARLNLQETSYLVQVPDERAHPTESRSYCPMRQHESPTTMRKVLIDSEKTNDGDRTDRVVSLGSMTDFQWDEPVRLELAPGTASKVPISKAEEAVDQQPEHSTQFRPARRGCPGNTAVSHLPPGSSVPAFPGTRGDHQGSAAGEEDKPNVSRLLSSRRMGQKPRSQLPQYCDGARLNLQETSYLVQVPDERAHPTESRSYCPMRQHETNDGDRTDRVVSLGSMTDFQWDEPVRLELAPVQKLPPAHLADMYNRFAYVDANDTNTNSAATVANALNVSRLLSSRRMGQKPRSQLPQYCDGARLNLQETSYLVQVPDEQAHPTESRSYCPMRQHETNDGDRTDRVVSLGSMTDFQWDEPVRLELAPGSFALIVLSYLYLIFFTFHKVRSQEGRWKPFTTCASHLTVVALLYIPVLFNYTPPSSGSSLQRDVQVSLLYSAVTPALNPLIYTLRNPEKRSALKKMLCFEWT
ncbi:hypothetical protein Q9966_006427 [Columba livia]|nr:hypothetical protein Q9966_006427 [Columba livia]